MHSTMAAASSSGEALGIWSIPSAALAKMGRTRTVQLGRCLGLVNASKPQRIPAMYVPWKQAALLF